MITEAEARTRWCPFARAIAPNIDANGNPGTPHAAINRGDGGAADIDSLCIGSRCMAWRWSRVNHYSGGGYCGLVTHKP